MAIQPIPEQNVAVVDEPGLIRVLDAENKDATIIMQVCAAQHTAQFAHELAVEIIGNPARVAHARAAFGYGG